MTEKAKQLKIQGTSKCNNQVLDVTCWLLHLPRCHWVHDSNSHFSLSQFSLISQMFPNISAP